MKNFNVPEMFSGLLFKLKTFCVGFSANLAALLKCPCNTEVLYSDLDKSRFKYPNNYVYSVITPDKKIYGIYDKGYCDGFPKDSTIINYMPLYFEYSVKESINKRQRLILTIIPTSLLFHEIMLRFFQVVFHKVHHLNHKSPLKNKDKKGAI